MNFAMRADGATEARRNFVITQVLMRAALAAVCRGRTADNFLLCLAIKTDDDRILFRSLPEPLELAANRRTDIAGDSRHRPRVVALRLRLGLRSRRRKA